MAQQLARSEKPAADCLSRLTHGTRVHRNAMRITFRRILNLLLYLSFCVMVGTGLLMAYRLIPGSRGGQGLEVLGWNRHEWGALHTWVSYVFITLVAAHLAINWAWLTKVAAKGHAWHLGAGLLAGAVIIGTFLLLPITKRQGETGKSAGYPSMSHREANSFVCHRHQTKV